MSAPTHSAGPWAYRTDRTIADAAGVPLARCYADRNAEANGPLFAAAPELLAAAEAVLTGLCERIDSAPPDAVPLFAGIADLHSAIAKAKGGEA